MLKRLVVSTLLSCFLSVTFVATADSLTIKKLWSTKAELKEPESVVYDIMRRSLYVSNVNGAPDVADGNGFISLIANDGTIEKLKWIDGLNAPKGMAIFGNNLFVTDINELLVIDLKMTKVTKRFTLEGKHFLNDIAVSQEGMIYVTDTATDTIYRLYNDKFEVWLTDSKLANPNGIYIDNKNITIGSWGKPVEGWKTDIPGHLLLVSLKDKSIKNFATGEPIGNLDGVAKLDNSTFIVTDWYQGKLIKASANGEVKTLLELGQGSADIYYRRSKKLLLISHMLEGRLIAYSIQ